MILALDIGTSSSRSAIYDTRGKRLIETTAQWNYPLQTGPDGRAELRPADLDRAVARAVIATLEIWRAKKQTRAITGIGVSCFWHSLLGLDSRGHPLTPIYTWADSRCQEEAKLLRRNSGEALLHNRTGCMTRTSFWPAKLLWLRKTNPRLFAAVDRWVSPAEWIQLRWCGKATVSLSMASGTGLLNGHTLQWDAPLLRRCLLHSRQLSPPFRIAAKTPSGPRQKVSRPSRRSLVSSHRRWSGEQSRLRCRHARCGRHQRWHQRRAPCHLERSAYRPQTDGAARTLRLSH